MFGKKWTLIDGAGKEIPYKEANDCELLNEARRISHEDNRSLVDEKHQAISKELRKRGFCDETVPLVSYGSYIAEQSLDGRWFATQCVSHERILLTEDARPFYQRRMFEKEIEGMKQKMKKSRILWFVLGFATATGVAIYI